MDDNGNILARRYSKSNVFVKGAANLVHEETAIGSEILKSANQSLELAKVMKVNLELNQFNMIHCIVCNDFSV